MGMPEKSDPRKANSKPKAPAAKKKAPAAKKKAPAAKKKAPAAKKKAPAAKKKAPAAKNLAPPTKTISTSFSPTKTVSPISRPERQRLIRKKAQRRKIGATIIAAVVAVGAVAVFLTTRGEDQKPTLAAKPVTRTTTASVGFKSSAIATTTGGALDVYAEPSTTSTKITQLSPLTEYKFARTVLVTEQRDGWVKAILPIRPNNTEGWIAASSVTLSTTNYEIEINLANHTLVLNDSGKPVMEFSVALGTTETPTPVGRFYVTDPIDLTKKLDPIYGAYALGMSGYSEVLTSFRGGDGQLAIHGGMWEAQAGTNPSNGCIRMLNDQIVQLASIVPLGTPVVVTA
jgi:lipoprotein-anchoring transpeptidase ErfK/SrfK